MSDQIARINMVKQQLRTGKVVDETVIDLYHEIDRSAFVPSAYQHFAYSDLQIPLAHLQRMMTPLEEALLLQSLDLKGHEVVLEVGTGTGFLTALLSRRCKSVLSIDYYAKFTTAARQKLAEHECTNVELLTEDALTGWLEKAPYDVMVFSGAIDALNETYRLQLLPGGKLFAIVGVGPVMQGQLHELDHHGNWHSSLIFETHLPSLINQSKPNNFVF